jgi:hypothetical protein
LLFSVLIGVLVASGLRAAAADTPGSKAAAAGTAPNSGTTIDSAESAMLESEFDKLSCVGTVGIWPQNDALQKAKPYHHGPHYPGEREDWFGRVLKKSVQPEKGQWNSKEWVIVPQLRWEYPADWLLGHFASQDPRIARIEFQESSSSYNLAITIISAELFPNKEFDASEVRDKLGELLNIPADCLPHLKMDLKHAVVGKDKIMITYGTVFDARYADPLTTELAGPPAIEESTAGTPPVTPSPARETEKYVPLIPDDKREWFSPMSFCIFKGRLLFRVSTVDWKGGVRPMTEQHKL